MGNQTYSIQTINREGYDENNDYYYYIRCLRVFSRCEDVAKDRNTRNHLVWIVVNGDPMHGVYIPHSIPRAWEQQ